LYSWPPARRAFAIIVAFIELIDDPSISSKPIFWIFLYALKNMAEGTPLFLKSGTTKRIAALTRSRDFLLLSNLYHPKGKSFPSISRMSGLKSGRATK